VVAPKTVHAVASALVTVANTSANPVPTIAPDNPARTAMVLRAFCLMPADFTECTAPFDSSSGSFVVPVGQRLVVDCVSGAISFNPGQTASVAVTATTRTAGGGSQTLPMIFPVVGSSFSNSFGVGFSVSSPMTAYFDPGTSLGVAVQRAAATSDTVPDGIGESVFELYGHLASLQ
jgi:hypothetical protein